MRINNKAKQDFMDNYKLPITEETPAIKALIIARFNMTIYLPTFKSDRFKIIGKYLLSNGGSIEKN